VNCAC